MNVKQILIFVNTQETGNDLKQARKGKKNVNYWGLGGNRKITTNRTAISNTYKDIEGVRGSLRLGKEEDDGNTNE